MAAPPVLLVADDLAIIAAVKRVLAREGYECILATNAADAVIAWGHALPGLLLMQPSVESERGAVVLEELQLHPDAQLLKVVLLGETIPGFPWPVEPLPIDPEHLAGTIEDNIRTGTAQAGWSVLETTPPAVAPAVPESHQEPEAWRATSPREVDPSAQAAEVPEPTAVPELARPTPEALEEKLFGDLAADVEAQAMQSVESSLNLPPDDELQRLEDEVRAEAQRRRQTREAKAVEVKPAPPTPPEASPPPTPADAAEASFGDLADRPAPAPSRAAEVLGRAEQMVLETRAQADAHRRADEADARRQQAELDAAHRRAEHAEELVRSEREARGLSDDAIDGLKDELKRSENERELARVRHENELEALRAEWDAERQAQGARAESDARSRAEHERLVEGLREQVRALETALEAASLQVAQAKDAAGTAASASNAQQQALQAKLAQLELIADTALDEQQRRHAAEARVAQLEGHLTQGQQQLAQLEAQLTEAHAQRATEQEQRAALEAQLAEAGARLTQLELIASSAVEEQDKRKLIEAAHAQEQQRVAELSDSLEAAREEAAAAVAVASELAAERQRLAETQAALQVAEEHLAEIRGARDQAQAEMLALEQERERLQAQLSELGQQLQHARADATSAAALLDEAAREQDELRAKVAALTPVQALAERLSAELDAERSARREAEARLTELGATLEATRSQAEELEATAQLATEKVKALEAREVLPVTLPGRGAVGLARHGTVDLEGLARAVCELVLSNAEVKVELGASGGTRTLWFKRGQIIAAESTFDAEGLIGRARRDGLIDARQDAELRMLRGATAREQLDALKARGFIRDIESVPLVQRYTEQVALDAFTEEQTLYRIVEEAPRPEVLLATVPRPTLPMLAESLRRAVAPDVLLERLGGGEAVPVATDSELELRALGFSERERKMLGWVDGEATVEDLSLASGLKPDVAFRALLVARLLGVITVKPGARKAEPTSAQLDVQRLEAKFDEVQDADYFTILGLSRAAGAEDVRRAFQRLSQEFDPLRFSGHPDPSLQQRAQVVANLLEEAARALEDDRRRNEYARHLLD